MLRAETYETALPDCRAYELVSPVEKNGGAVQGFGANFGGDVLQASASGEAATYSSSASFGEAQGAPPAGQYLARRTAAGWVTQNITAPLLSGSYGDHPDGVPYQLFSPDLARGLLLNGLRCRGEGSDCPLANPPLPGSGAPGGYQDYYLRDNEDGAFTALLSEADDGFLALGPEDFELSFAGATPDLRHVVLSTCAALTTEATEVPGTDGCEPAETNLYEWSEGALRLINVLPGHTHGTPDAHLAAQSGAISTDGRSVYFTDGEDSAIYLAQAGKPTVFLPETVGGGAAFQTASADGSIAFYTKGGSLYRYDAVTEAAESLATSVKGVLGASEGGSYLYYETASGLYQWHEDATTEIAPEGAPSDYPPATGIARVTPDGTHLAFLSSASLTGYPNGGDSEVYLYGPPPGAAAALLTCVSCNPSGRSPIGPSSIPGAIPNGEAAGSTDSYKPRDLSESGSRVFFDSEDALVPTDSNKAPDVYEWEAQGEGSCQKAAGCVGLLSGGQSGEGSEFIDASTDGSSVFFLTAESLLPQDPGSADLYDAREDGGFPQPPVTVECEGDSCQPVPATPEDPTPGTLVPGSGNPPLHFPKTPRSKPKRSHGKKHHRKRSRRRRAKSGRGPW